jgi:hypothetical protein
MHLQRDAWQTVSAMLEQNPQLPESYWWELMLDTYATTQAVAVRRQADLRADVVSLARLIAEIHDNVERLTKDWWLGLWGSPSHQIERFEAERQWGEHFGRDVGTHLDPAIPTTDAETLKAAAHCVRHYVNKHVAHADEVESSEPNVTLQVSDVHEAIETIGVLFRRYSSLLTCSTYMTLVPAIQHDWLAAFRVPWMRRNFTPPS